MKDKQENEPMEVDQTKVNDATRKRKRSKTGKVFKNKKLRKMENEIIEENEKVVTSTEISITKSKWTNKTRVLVFSSRGVPYLQRHLMNDLRSLMPHSKPETKMEKSSSLFIINEICELNNCNKCIFFEAKKKTDLYMWMSNVPAGPSVKFLVENIHTMSELKLTGNCLKGSRPLLSFDKKFETAPQWLLLKELFTQVFGVPNFHPKSKPFVDHVMTFSIIGNRVWIRSFQIVEENAELVEIGPRMTLNLIKIFKGSFCGETLFDNPQYITPNSVRSMLKKKMGTKYEQRIAAKVDKDSRKPDYSVFEDGINKIFEH